MRLYERVSAVVMLVEEEREGEQEELQQEEYQEELQGEREGVELERQGQDLGV